MIDPISWAHSWPYILAALAGGYLLGALPFGLILTRLAGMGDIRAIGSGNIGATNVLRTGNKKIAAATLLLDGAKGAIAVLIAQAYGPDIAIVAATGAFLGHLFPVWLKFRGGKGVATALGILLALSPPVGGLACASWLLAAALFRYSSLSALIALAASPAYMWWLADPQRTEFAIAMAVLVWIRHRENIGRLLRGQESRIGGSRKS
ncbi:MAG: glycerol-3-phosphate acyltransferase PlsY [Paracoccaceae bacterium]|jgi:glycerol-3-phosphate acyltransferase PlsY